MSNKSRKTCIDESLALGGLLLYCVQQSRLFLTNATQGRVIRAQKVRMSARKALAAIAVWQVAELGLWGAASPVSEDAGLY